jgi:chromosome segregation ATPase
LDRWDPKTRWKEGPWHTFVFNYTTSKHAKDTEACCTCLSLEAQEQDATDWARLEQVQDEHKATILRKCGIEENLTDEEEFQWETDQRHQREEAERRERQEARERAMREQEERKKEREDADRKHVQDLERQFEKTRQEIQTAQVELVRREQVLVRREGLLSQRERECTRREQESVRLRQKLGRLQRVLEGHQRESDQRELDLQERARSLDERERAIDLPVQRVPERMEEDVKPRIGKVEEEVPGDAEVRPRVNERVDTRVDGGRDPVSEPRNVEDRLARLEEQLASLIDNGSTRGASRSGPARKRPRTADDDDDALA